MNLNIENQAGIYFGKRGQDFKNLIKEILKKSNIREKYINILTDENSMNIFSNVFTSDIVDPDNNYQVYEQLGDLSGNKFIVTYMYKRFPRLMCSEGVKIVARLRINYGAKNSFADIGSMLGFWPYITATNDMRYRKKKALLEDVFEAFLGATEHILDNRVVEGLGYGVIYDILKNIFDDIDISLKYEDLYDAKTRLKELFDIHEDTLGPLVYSDEKVSLNENETIFVSSCYRVENGQYNLRPDGSKIKTKIIGGKHILISKGQARLKIDAQQQAAAKALKVLEKYIKPVDKIYDQENKKIYNDDDILTINKIKEKWGDDINAMVFTKNKNKYNICYTSTPLTLYCRTKKWNGIKVCLENGADPNILDSDGLSVIDHLFMGNFNEELVIKIIKLLQKYNVKLHIQRSVFDKYRILYKDDFFNGLKFNIIDDMKLCDLCDKCLK